MRLNLKANGDFYDEGKYEDALVLDEVIKELSPCEKARWEEYGEITLYAPELIFDMLQALPKGIKFDPLKGEFIKEKQKWN